MQRAGGGVAVGGGRSRAGFTIALAAAMAAGTFAGPVLAVLARFLIDDLGLTRGELGLAAAAFSTVAAIASPTAGRLTDRIGGRRALAATFAVAGGGLVGMAFARSAWALIAAAAVGGLGQAFANPGTNKLISVHVPHGQRGVLTGLKQSGVQAGVFLAGMLMPSAALRWGWRATVAVAGAVFVLWVVLLPRVVPADPRRGEAAPHLATRLPSGVWWLAVFGLLMGAAGGAIATYLPLYAEEALGLSVTAAGVLAGATGLVALGARIAWSSAAERAEGFARPLGAMAALAVGFTVAMLLAPIAGVWLLWLGALGHAATGLAWNSVGMLAVMSIGGPDRAGRASGIVLLGFLTGYGLGPPVFGWSVDTTGRYRAGLVAAAIAFGAATALTAAWRRSTVAVATR